MQYRLSQNVLYLQTTSIFRESVIKIHLIFTLIFYLAQQPPPPWATASSFTRFLDHTQRRTTVSRTYVEEWSARRRDLHLTTHNTHNRQTIHVPGGIRAHNLSRRSAVDRPRGHWDRLICTIVATDVTNGSPPTHPRICTDACTCLTLIAVAYRGGLGGSNPSRNYECLPKSCQTQPDCENR